MPLRSALHFRVKPHRLPKELRGYFAHFFSLRTADALLLVALPVGLYEYGTRLEFIGQFFSDPMARGLFCVMLYFSIARLASLALSQPLAKVFGLLGIAHTMMLGQFLLIASYVTFPLSQQIPALYFLSAMLRGVGVFLYWVGHFSYFGSVIKPKHLGEEVGVLEFITKLAVITAPLISAFLVVRFGYLSAFLTGALFAAGAAALLLTIPNFHTKFNWNWPNFFSDIRQRDYQKIALGMSGFAWEQIGINILWPVFLFVTFTRITTVSYILSGATLASLLLIYLSGIAFDHRLPRRLQSVAGVGMGLLWIPRALLAQFPLSLVVTEALDKLLAGVYGTLFSATLMSRSLGGNILAFYINREVVLSITLIGGFTLATALLWFGWSWSLVFLSFVAGALASLSLRTQSQKI